MWQHKLMLSPALNHKNLTTKVCKSLLLHGGQHVLLPLLLLLPNGTSGVGLQVKLLTLTLCVAVELSQWGGEQAFDQSTLHTKISSQVCSTQTHLCRHLWMCFYNETWFSSFSYQSEGSARWRGGLVINKRVSVGRFFSTVRKQQT